MIGTSNLKAAQMQIEYQESILQIRGITGRSEAVAKRGFARIGKIAQHRPDVSHTGLFREWKRRQMHWHWGQRGRLQRLGFAA